MTNRESAFTKHDINDFHEYESVRKDGAFNMYDPRARELTGLSRERYLFVMKNYTELKAESERIQNENKD